MDAFYEVSVDRRVVGTCAPADVLALANSVKKRGRLVMFRKLGEWPPGAPERGRSVLFENGYRTPVACPGAPGDPI